MDFSRIKRLTNLMNLFSGYLFTLEGGMVGNVTLSLVDNKPMIIYRWYANIFLCVDFITRAAVDRLVTNC